MIYETIINPGQGLGNYIKLGASLFDIINQLDKHKYKFRITFSETNFYQTPTLVKIVDLGIRLTFTNHPHQYLELIEVLNLDDITSSKKLLRLIYNGQSLNDFENDSNDSNEVNSIALEATISKNSSSSTILDTSPVLSSTSSTNSTIQTLTSSGPSFKTIYNKIFGPTYPGKLSRDKKTYILSYPGISFKFKILNNALLDSINEDDEHQILSKLLNWDNLFDVTCDSIALYKGNSWEDYQANKEKEKRITTSYEINKLVVNLNQGIVKILGNNSEDIIKIGSSTQQEVVNILGPPDEYFNKFDSRLLIHNHLSDIESNSYDISHCKFHNYYKYGIDILYDLNNSKGNQNKLNTTVKKIIIHNGGIPEDLNFMKWNSCNWEINDSKFSINSTMYFNQLPEIFHDLNPVLLNRNESEFIDHDLDIIKMPDQHETEEEENPRVKTWGQSKLYGLDRCILEVINSNGCISTVTIY